MTDPVAVYGAVTATVALVFSGIGAYIQLKDRPLVRVRFRVVAARHGRVSPGMKHVIVDVANTGRRRALVYPPVLRFVDRPRDGLSSKSPDEMWEDGATWIPTDDAGDPPVLVQLDEYTTITYLHHLHPGRRVVRLEVLDSLVRRRTRYVRFGRLVLFGWRLRAWLCRLLSRKNQNRNVPGTPE